jgi:RNA polymerase sigma factor for flagellar operon FliA
MNELIESHIGFAHAIAAELAGKYPPNITRADLEGAAELGLVLAARNYDPSRSVSFATFAYYRVRGAIFDEVRKAWQASHPKSGSNTAAPDNFADAVPHQEAQTSWEGFEDSTFPSLGSTSFISLGSNHSERLAATTESPANQVLRREESEAIQEALKKLPKRHRFVLRAYYYEELSLVSIGRQLNLSKSWVSRIHAQALAMVRKILQESRKPPAPQQPAPSHRRRSAISPQATFCCE